MPRKEGLPLREREICSRLRAFREGTGIPRTAFAAKIGVVGARLLNCEIGLSPVRYALFRAINAQFFVSAKWLVTGISPKALARPVDDERIQAQIGPRALLSEVYDQILGRWLEDREYEAHTQFFGPDGIKKGLERLVQICSDRQSLREIPDSERVALLGILDAVRAVLNLQVKQD